MRQWMLFALGIFFITSSTVYAENQSWNEWVTHLRQDALSQGISAPIFDTAFADIHEPSKQVKGLSRSQPEHRLTYPAYLKSRIDAYRINIGRREFKKNKELLQEIATSYQVDPCFIVSFWGLETSYGSYMGKFPVIKSLATLAYESSRKDFFRNELLVALHILNEGHVSLEEFKGEWAGASGQSQFLPSSWLKYAVDYDKDGRKNIWTSKADVFASIANYMKLNGWKEHEPWAIYVTLPDHFDRSLEGKTTSKTVAEWSAMGIKTETGQNLPYPQLMASIIQPNEGPVFLAYPNYRMILRYNNSIYYAGAIGFLADKICEQGT